MVVVVVVDWPPICRLLGDDDRGPPGEADQEPNEEWVKSREHEGRAYQDWDEDADVDESGEFCP